MRDIQFPFLLHVAKLSRRGEIEFLMRDIQRQMICEWHPYVTSFGQPIEYSGRVCNVGSEFVFLDKRA
jgi:hypothetical protein